MTILIFKALHIVGFVAWFSGMFYLVRLFVYHAEAETAEEVEKNILKKQYAIMEKRVYQLIMNPAMMITFTFGIAMLIMNPYYLKMGWMHMKLLFVILLLAYHLFCKKKMNELQKGTNTYTSFNFRMMNEVPTIFLLGIVMLAVLKTGISPFIILTIMALFSIFIFLIAKIYQNKRKKSN